MDDPQISNETKKGSACPHSTLPPWLPGGPGQETPDAPSSPRSLRAVRQASGNTAVLKVGSRDPASPQNPLGDG